jgi:RND family efflux transporter MFP subunit
MNHLSHPAAPWALAAVACLGLAGCGPGQAENSLPPPDVEVSTPLERYVLDYGYFTGRTAAVESVKVRAHVWGYLDKINFTEGAEVKKNDVLFKIDPRPYDAALAQAEANLKQAEAHRITMMDGVSRDRASPVATPQAVLTQDEGNLAEAEAAVGSARAARDYARLNLTYTDVVAPVGGRVSNALVTVGNLVQSGDQNGGTILTSIVSLEPMWAYFDVDDLTYLRIKRALNQCKCPPLLQLGLVGEDGYPHDGAIDFVDNQVDPGTGTMRMRGVFPNKDRALTPGLFARVRLSVGDPHPALLVADRAVDTDQGQKVAYVVGQDNLVQQRPVRLGGLHDGLREIVSGLKSGETVVVDGLQMVRPGAPVQPRVVDMPLPSNGASAADREARRQGDKIKD